MTSTKSKKVINLKMNQNDYVHNVAQETPTKQQEIRLIQKDNF